MEKIGTEIKGITRENKALKNFIEVLKNDSLISFRVIKPNYRDFLNDKFMLANAVKLGIPKSLFNEIATFSILNDEDWCRSLDINLRTFQRYKKAAKHTFKPTHSERILEIAEVYQKGFEVFDSIQDFKEWINTPSLALGRKRPLDLLDSSYGKELVMAELERIEHGIFV